jgi:hypothetical protein
METGSTWRRENLAESWTETGGMLSSCYIWDAGRVEAGSDPLLRSECTNISCYKGIFIWVQDSRAYRGRYSAM